MNHIPIHLIKENCIGIIKGCVGLIVSIPKAILFIPQDWQVETLHIYSLSRYCIGISPKEIVDWKVNALHHEEVSCEHTSATIKFKLPLILYNFYGFVQNDLKYSLSGNGEAVLMIIEKKDSSEKIYSDSCLKIEE
jgi:hypothetical protein